MKPPEGVPGPPPEPCDCPRCGGPALKGRVTFCLHHYAVRCAACGPDYLWDSAGGRLVATLAAGQMGRGDE